MADNIFLGLTALLTAHWLATTLPAHDRAIFRLVALAVALPFGYRFEVNARAGITGEVLDALENGEFVLPGVPLITLVDLQDMWVQFDLREDLLHDLKTGSQITVRVPALGDRQITLAVLVIGAQGEYTGWRATRSSGDFDLRTFEIRAYPTQPISGLRPGMSAYTDWNARP